LRTDSYHRPAVAFSAAFSGRALGLAAAVFGLQTDFPQTGIGRSAGRFSRPKVLSATPAETDSQPTNPDD
jgi:hypothetical protein